MPLTKLGPKSYYIGIFFKVINFYWQSLLLCHQNFAFQANWARSAQYCRYHGMHLASIDSAQVEEMLSMLKKLKTNVIQDQKKLEEHIESIGLGHEHFWTSGTDQGEEGK